jgi:hypothetical protein
MFAKTLPVLAVILLAASPQLPAQGQNPNPPANPTAPATNEKIEDKPEPNRFWQATLAGGHYMVSLERISSISRHKYVLDGAVIVDEVTVDSLGQALARFYFLSPISDAATGNAAGAAASRIIDRGRELVDRTAGQAGTEIHNMVVKKFPETTHARTIEYRVLSEQELGALYSSVRTAWETGRGRKFRIK